LLARSRGRRGPGAGALAGAGVRGGAIAMAVIVLVSLLVVVMAANRPSLLSPTTHTNYYPRWMAGPLGGLWPSLTDNGTTLKYLFSAAIVSMYVAYMIALRAAPRLPTRWIAAALVAVHAVFVLAPPLALTDVFNYINYGRMEVVHHLNPYTTIPISEPHSDPSFILSNWHQLLSPYGPMFTLLTFVVVPLGVAGSFWALKAILALASLATILLVWKCARLLGRDPRSAVVLVGLNPIVLVWGLGGDHNDFLMLACIMLGFYLLLRARARAGAPSVEEEGRPEHRAGLRGLLLPLSPAEIGAGAAFVIAVALKASGGVLLPVVLAGLVHAPRRLTQVLVGMIVAAVLVGAASLLAFGLHIPDLSTQSRLVTSESIPNLLGLAVGAGGESAGVHKLMSVALGLSVLACCWLAWRRRETITASGWASVALIVTLSWVLPWYVLWILPLAALSSSRRLRVTALALGVYLIVAWAPASGLLWNAIGFHPEKTPLGRLHQRYVRELLN
jgi:alpha-1,6-mannosyltransferase